MIDAIQNILNKPYGAKLQGQNRKYVCWKFCRDIYDLLDLPPLKKIQHQSGLTRIAAPRLHCIVLFNVAGDWHAGVVYPDILHFIHAAPLDIRNRDTTEYVACRERLTVWPYNLMVEGYYAP